MCKTACERPGPLWVGAIFLTMYQVLDDGDLLVRVRKGKEGSFDLSFDFPPEFQAGMNE